MSEKIKGIVIKSSDRKEKDANVLLFSLEKGKIWVTLKGVRGQNAKMKLAQNQFCFGEYVVEEGKSGLIVTNFECIESFHEIPENIEKYFESSAVLEIIDKLRFSSENERAKIFVLTLKTLKTICFNDVQNIYALNKFLIELFNIFGVPLYVDKCACCGSKVFDKLYFDFNSGEFLCVGCKHFDSKEISRAVYSALKILSQTDFDKLSTLKLANGSEKELLRLLVENFACKFDENLKIMGIL